ncbi:MAG: FecR domain-containing protein [Leptospira sp.]|nr:FecR domain-containing protein [Leptospira sp.]
MGKILYLTTSLTILLFILGCKDKDSIQEQSIPKDELASIVYMVIGDVTVTDETGKKVTIQPKLTRLYSNHTIQTFDNSSMDILLYDGTIVRIYKKTTLEISNVLDTQLAQSNSKIKMASGKIFVKTNKLTKNRRIDVQTSNSVAGVRGTEFQVIDGDNESKILVGEGSVEGSNISGTSSYVIEPGQKMEVREDEAELMDMSEEEKDDFQKESQSVASIVEDGRKEIQGILDQFQEEKGKILETIEIQKQQNKELIEEQKSKNQELIRESKERTKSAKKEVEEKSKSELDKIKSGSQSEMDRIKSGSNN